MSATSSKFEAFFETRLLMDALVGSEKMCPFLIRCYDRKKSQGVGVLPRQGTNECISKKEYHIPLVLEQNVVSTDGFSFFVLFRFRLFPIIDKDAVSRYLLTSGGIYDLRAVMTYEQ